MRAIIVADGDIRPGLAVDEALLRADLIVAADGGAHKAMAVGLRPGVVVGDGDSLSAEQADELRRDGAEVIVHPVEKDESDTELAVLEALARGATSIVLIGAFGGDRVEHTAANLLLLTLHDLAGVDVALVDGPSTVRVIGLEGAGQIAIAGEPGDFVSLLPLAEAVDGVTTQGLRFPLHDEKLRQGATRGLSNELTAQHAQVTTRRGSLAVIHTRRSGVDQ